MYAVYFVCYGATLLVTYVAHLSLRGTQQHGTSTTNGDKDDDDLPQTDPTSETVDGNCLWSEWSAWSDCTVTCGQGLRVRHRTVLEQPLYPGNSTRCLEDDAHQEKPCSANSIYCYTDSNYVFPQYNSFFADHSSGDGDPQVDADDIDNTVGDDSIRHEYADSVPPLFDDLFRLYTTHQPRSAGRTTQHPRIFSADTVSGRRDSWLRREHEEPPPPPPTDDSQHHQHQQFEESGTFCSSFDCSSPDSPTGGGPSDVWNDFLDDLDRRQKASSNRPTAGIERNADGGKSEDNKQGSGDEKFERSQGEDHRETERDEWKSDKDDSREHSKRESLEDSRRVDDDQVDDDDASEGGGQGETGEDEMTGDEVDEDEEDDGNENDEDVDDEESKDRKQRKRSIPEDEELDDKEEDAEEENDDEKKKKKPKKKCRNKLKRKKRKRKKLVRKKQGPADNETKDDGDILTSNKCDDTGIDVELQQQTVDIGDLTTEQDQSTVSDVSQASHTDVTNSHLSLTEAHFHNNLTADTDASS